MLVATIACLSMTACNNTATTQGQLRNILSDHNNESFEYDVFAKNANGDKVDGYDGTYVVTLKAYSDGSQIENFGSSSTTLENLSAGVFVKGVLNVGTQSYETGCYFKLIDGSSYMVPAYSYRVQKDGETETLRVFGSYDGKKFSYTRTFDGKTDEGVVEAGNATFYDNNEFHQSLRTITTFTDSLSFAFAVPLVSATETTSVGITATVNGKTDVKTAFTASREDYQEKRHRVLQNVYLSLHASCRHFTNALLCNERREYQRLEYETRSRQNRRTFQKRRQHSHDDLRVENGNSCIK